jgi:hypothetical protein
VFSILQSVVEQRTFNSESPQIMQGQSAVISFVRDSALMEWIEQASTARSSREHRQIYKPRAVEFDALADTDSLLLNSAQHVVKKAAMDQPGSSTTDSTNRRHESRVGGHHANVAPKALEDDACRVSAGSST